MKAIISVVLCLFPRLAAGVPWSEQGDKGAYWERSSVIAAEVVQVEPLEPPGSEPRYVLRPLITLSGRLDASLFASINASFMLPEDGIGEIPAFSQKNIIGKVVLAAVSDDNHPGEPGTTDFQMVVTTTTFMQRTKQVLEILENLSDDQIKATLASIQRVRKGEDPAKQVNQKRRQYEDPYWRSHAVIVATVKEISQPNKGRKSSLTLNPRGTLAGNFDAGKTPQLIADLEVGRLPQRAIPVIGAEAIIVIQLDKNSFRVPSDEVPDYMPDQGGLRPPFCIVKDLSDPIVRKTIDQLKVTREAERKTKKEQTTNRMDAR